MPGPQPWAVEGPLCSSQGPAQRSSGACARGGVGRPNKIGAQHIAFSTAVIPNESKSLCILALRSWSTSALACSRELLHQKQRRLPGIGHDGLISSFPLKIHFNPLFPSHSRSTGRSSHCAGNPLSPGPLAVVGCGGADGSSLLLEGVLAHRAWMRISGSNFG